MTLENWHTWREIHAQPSVWRGWAHALDAGAVRDWVERQTYDEIWFCGAGTSAYIGDILAAEIPGTRSVPSTDLVANPQLLRGRRPLIVNFGRSGSSTESVGTLDAVEALAPSTAILNITCNKSGVLATRSSAGPNRVILLPEATHDRGFAMTSSFSTMLLTALSVFAEPCDYARRMIVLADALEALLSSHAACPSPDRAVYVGAGPLTYAAREAALKVMELSAGQIPALWDSSLGFRHGPKSFVRGDTNISVFISPSTPAARYDTDLIGELEEQFPSAQVKAIGSVGDFGIPADFGPAWAAPLYVATAQLDAAIWAHEMGLNVDNPFDGAGTLTRVVGDVHLYPVIP